MILGFGSGSYHYTKPLQTQSLFLSINNPFSLFLKTFPYSSPFSFSSVLLCCLSMRLGCCYSTKATPPHTLFSFTRMGATPTTKTSKEKIIVIMGATGTGKSRLSIDLATRFFPSEIINSDKIQVYKGLDITTNKIPLPDRRGVPHHLLGEFDSHLGELTPSEYRSLASASIEEIVAKNKLPLVVGGSNSLIQALVTDDSESENSFLSANLRYDCCFLWVDVGLQVLYEYLLRRVDDMFDSGMLDELAEFFESEEEAESGSERSGIKKAIGVPEFEDYFRGAGVEINAAVEEIKINTCRLAVRQMGKIQGLRARGWDLKRLNATEVFRAVLASDSDKSGEIWEREVVEPSVKIVKRFLGE